MKSIRLQYGSHRDQFGDLRLPDDVGPHPVVIVIHGGFWKESYGLELMDLLSDAITAQGYATWNIEYRRVGNSEGGWPNTLLDAASAADFLHELKKKYPLDLDRLATLGHSAGGQLALWLAARHTLLSEDVLFSPEPIPLRCAISLAGVSDLRLMARVHRVNEDHQHLNNNPTKDLLNGFPEDVPERYQSASPAERLPLGVLQFLIHGNLDVHVPVGISEQYYEKAVAMGDNVQLITLPTVEHFNCIEPESVVFPVILDCLASLE